MKHFWLFKAEPDVYGIEHLAAAPEQTGRWDGIRNYQARNFLRDQIKPGDDLFIYHSQCKKIGIVGTARVVKGAYPDPTQFDPENKYYDPKSNPDSPRWFSVDITLNEVFPNVLPLAKLKTEAGLSDMVLLKQGRLSIQPVTAAEWKVILKMKPEA